MIDLNQYLMNRQEKYASDYTAEIQTNAANTVAKVNELLQVSGFSRRVTSGWRPAALNATVPGAAKKSNHIMALACDLEDKDGALDAWCETNLDKLEQVGIWLESPKSTIGWSHWQIVAPHSGNRIFIP